MESKKQDKANKFAVRIINLYKYLCNTKNEQVLSKQILRAGTSIGANLYEAEHAQSRDDYINRNSISLKEANETRYWLKMLRETNYITEEQYKSLLTDCQEIIKMLVSSIKTLKYI